MSKIQDVDARLFKAHKSWLKSIDSALIFMGFAAPGDATPAAILNQVYMVTATGTVFGLAAVDGNFLKGDVAGWGMLNINGSYGEMSQKANKIDLLIEADILSILFPFKALTNTATASIDNHLTMQAGSICFGTAFGWNIPINYRSISFTITSTKNITGLFVYLSRTDSGETIELFPISWTDMGNGLFEFSENYTILNNDDRRLFVMKFDQSVVAETTEIYFKSIISGKSFSESLNNQKNQSDSINSRLVLIEDVVTNVLLSSLIPYNNAIDGAIISVDNHLILPLGTTCLYAVLGWNIPLPFKNISFTIYSTKNVAGLFVYVSKSDHTNNIELFEITWTVLDNGIFSFTGDCTTFEADNTILFIMKLGSNILSENAEIYFKSISDNDKQWLNVSLANQKVSIDNLNDRMAIIENLGTGEILNSLIPYINTIDGASASSDNHLTLQSGFANLGAVIGYQIPFNYRKLSFTIISTKNIAGLFVFLSKLDHSNNIQLFPIVWTNLGNGTFKFSGNYTILGAEDAILFVMKYDSIIVPTTTEIYFKSIVDEGSPTVELGEVKGIPTAFLGTDGIATNLGTAIKQNGKITSITFNAVQTGSANFVLGLIDQWGKAITDSPFSVLVTYTGVQTHYVNIPIKLGQQVFVLLNTKVIGKTTYDVYSLNKLIYNITGRYDVVTPFNGANGGSLNLKYTAEYVSETVSSLSLVVDNISNRVAAMESVTYITDDTTGLKYKLLVNNGILSIKSTAIKKALALGNSITKHPITSFWWGLWGMAATIRAKDWVHVLESILKIKDVTAVVNALEIGDFERNPLTFDKSFLDSSLTIDLDLVLLRIGENVGDETNYSANFISLIEYIWSKVPNCQIIVGGTFWESISKNTIMKAASIARGIIFVDMSSMWGKPQYSSSMETLVYGDDFIWHSISEGGSTAPGVAAHPGDLGHQTIAELFAAALGY